MTRQAAWQHKQKAAGRCITCGKPRRHYADRCDIHALWFRRYLRTRNENQPWRLGRVGQPPLIPDVLAKKVSP